MHQFGSQTQNSSAPVFFTVITMLVHTVTEPEFAKLVKKCFIV